MGNGHPMAKSGTLYILAANYISFEVLEVANALEKGKFANHFPDSMFFLRALQGTNAVFREIAGGIHTNNIEPLLLVS